MLWKVNSSKLLWAVFHQHLANLLNGVTAHGHHFYSSWLLLVSFLDKRTNRLFRDPWLNTGSLGKPKRPPPSAHTGKNFCEKKYHIHSDNRLLPKNCFSMLPQYLTKLGVWRKKNSPIFVIYCIVVAWYRPIEILVVFEQLSKIGSTQIHSIAEARLIKVPAPHRNDA